VNKFLKMIYENKIMLLGLFKENVRRLEHLLYLIFKNIFG